MKTVQHLLSENTSLQNASVERMLKSKKHTVVLIRKNKKYFVLKWHEKSSKQAFLQEYKILKKVNTPFKKPELIEINENYQFFILSYISGENVCDLINDQKIKTQDKEKIIINLAIWFSQFHHYFQHESKILIHGDAHLRNFITTKENIMYGVDFEENHFGKTHEDIANLCASILTTRPEFTEEKYLLSNQLVQTYEDVSNQKIPAINTLIDQAVDTTMKRRNERKHQH